MSDDIQTKINALIASRKGIIIASLNEDKLPEISATPFVQTGLCFYIFISELATHTQNIKQHPQLSVMLVEDEQDTSNTFARKRLSFKCTASIIKRDSQSWKSILDKFEEKQGKTVGVLRQLPDFNLFELKAISGNYIEGFGKAYCLSGEDLSHIELKTGK